MVRMESPRARPSAISSRCANVKHRPFRSPAPTRSDSARRSQPAGALFAITASRDRSIVDELPSSHASPEHLINLRNHPIREPHTTPPTRDVAITARTRGRLPGALNWSGVRKRVAFRALPQLEVASASCEGGLCALETHSMPATGGDCGVPIVVIAAVSPVVFFAASRVVEAAGISAGFALRAGQSLCLVALSVPTMPLMAVAALQPIAAELARTWTLLRWIWMRPAP